MNKLLALSSLIALLGLSNSSQSQNSNPPDSIHKMVYMPEITLVGAQDKSDVIQLPEIVGTSVYAGKKNSLIILDNLNTVVVNNNMRQIFGKVPGINIWESDGSGIQIGIAARGLSPNRSWEFNIRQNGCDIAADPYGYPEAYYNPQMQAIQRIQVVRGAGALQYGPQFGGMVNYIMRDGSDIHKTFQFETQQTAGSFGLMNSFVAVGGEKGKLHYYAFYDVRKANGYRQNSTYQTQTAYASVTYHFTKRMKISGDFMKYYMLSQQPGGLTDANFSQNAKQSSRSRNWFSTPWITSNVKFDWEISKNSRLNAKAYGISGDRSSIGFLAPITTEDTINKNTGTYNHREVAVDYYRNAAIEIGFLHDYSISGKKQTLSLGARYYKGRTSRYQKGEGSTGSDADFGVTNGIFPTEVTYNSINQAVFAENIFRIGNKLLIIPGMRAERIVVNGAGRLGFNPDLSENNMKNETKIRTFLLPGIGLEYHVGKSGHNEIYANYTQAYRPVLFSNITSPTTDLVDPNMKDSKGFNADLGFRGKWKQYLHVDAGIYYLQYNNRIGNVTRLNSQGNAYRFITNLGNSHSYGSEILTEFDALQMLESAWSKKNGSFPIFVSYSYNISEYEDYNITSVSNGKEQVTNLKGNRVEYAPKHILRAGISYENNKGKLTFQTSYCSKVYSDAGNTEKPSANGQAGVIPSYTIFDITGALKLSKSIQLKFSVNNLTNRMYFTRRAGSYPGPGVLPSDGRSILISIAAKI